MNAKELLTEPIGFLALQRALEGLASELADRRIETKRDVLVATHNAHHLGQVILLRQLLGAWPPPAGSWTW